MSRSVAMGPSNLTSLDLYVLDAHATPSDIDGEYVLIKVDEINSPKVTHFPAF